MAVDARLHLIVALVGGSLATSAAGLAQDLPTVPHHGDAVHLGVATCASATCHGAVAPAQGGVVLQNEYTTWQSRDPHANAYAVLLNEQSQQIARKLGLEAAHTADVCLDCHTDNVAAARRGPQFQLTDGVGCEACHAGAQDWIQVHTVGDQNAHQRNLDAGLYPTPDPVARAGLCLSCHLGDETKFVTHRLMGAGHPRLSFELDTFTAIEPAHFVIDEDFDRKVVAAMASGDEETLATLPESYFKVGTAEIKNWYPVIAAMNSAGLRYHQVDYAPCYRSEAGTGNAMCFAYWQ